MPFAPALFLALARTLANQPTDEARLRTAVSRAYYAVFLTARDRLRVPGTGHAAVLQATRASHRAAGYQLDALYQLRVLADYNLDPADPTRTNWQTNWTRADALAARLMPLAAALAPPPPAPRGA